MQTISYSAVQDWRSCEERYWNRYVRRLRPKVESPAPTLGRVLHSYLATYYAGLASMTAPQAHEHAFESLQDFKEELQSLAWAAQVAGESETAASISQILPNTYPLVQAYYRVHGKQDAEEHRVVAVEERFEFPLWEGGPNVPVVLDLVTETRNGLALWEHKSTKNVPKHGRRLRDLQTTLYRAIYEEVFGRNIKEVIWNYINTRTLQRPQPLKSGKITERSDIHTTQELYKLGLRTSRQVQNNQLEVFQRIAERERDVIFPRHTLPMLQDESILLRDFVTSARAILKARENESTFIPVRNVGQLCDFCPYSRLCEAKIIGGDTAILESKYFKVQEERQEEYVSSNTIEFEDILD